MVCSTTGRGKPFIKITLDGRKTDNSLPSLLQKTSGYVKGLGAAFDADRQKLIELQKQLLNKQLRMVLVGPSQKDKNYLINFLCGEELLPEGWNHLRAIPICFQWGEEPALRTEYQDGYHIDSCRLNQKELLERILFLESNDSKSMIHISRFIIYYPSPLLAKGIILCDMPAPGHGTTSFFSEFDTFILVIPSEFGTSDRVPAFLDGLKDYSLQAIIFIGPDIPDKLKCNRLAFWKHFLREYLQDNAAIPLMYLPLNQKPAVVALHNDQEFFLASREDTEKYLLDLLDKDNNYNLAITGEFVDLINDLVFRLQLLMQSSKLPSDKLAEKKHALQERLKKIEQEKELLNDILTGDRKRTVEYLENQADLLRLKARSYLGDVVNNYMVKHKKSINIDALRDIIAGTIPLYFEPELIRLANDLGTRAAEIFRNYQEKGSRLIYEVYKNFAIQFDIPCPAPSWQTARINIFKIRKHSYWITYKWYSTFSPIPENLVERLLPADLRHSRIKKKMLLQVDDLVSHNVENLRWSSRLNLDHSFRLFSSTFHEQFTAAVKKNFDAVLQQKKSGDLSNIPWTISQLQAIAPIPCSFKRSGN